MFLLDDMLLGPGKAALTVFKELARKVEADWLDDDAVKQELQEIYALVEAGKISSQDFEARECKLLERLEQIARARFNDKWGHDAPVIEAEITAQPLPIVSAPLQIEPAQEMETPWQLDDLPVVAAPPPKVAPARPAPIVSPAPFVAAAPSAPAPPPLAPPAPVAPLALPVPSAPLALSISQVFESTARALAMLGLKVAVITSVAPEEGGWRVTADLVERRGIPDTHDLIGVYELRLDAAGSVMRYERTRLRRRGDLER